MNDIHSYLPRNRRLAEQLVGCRLQSIVRWLDAPADVEDDLRFEYGPAELVSGNGKRWLVDVEESKANLLLFDLAEGVSGPWYSGFTLREPVVADSSSDPLRFLLQESIVSVDVISRDPEPGVPDSYAMCGLRLTTESGAQLCVGTRLAEELPIQEVAFRLPGEVDPALRYELLREAGMS
ncbi:hypothetical protein ACFY41_02830 [Streptomyces syringium]|uniref:hypothetical protein n=1 Tax=Streptomyces syringium TaxID=76729 RepID=UPI0036944D08